MATLPRDIVEQVSKEFNIPKKNVTELYQLYWRHIRDFITSRTLNILGMCDEYTDIVIPHVGRLVLNLRKKRNINEREQRELHGINQRDYSNSKSN